MSCQVLIAQRGWLAQCNGPAYLLICPSVCVDVWLCCRICPGQGKASWACSSARARQLRGRKLGNGLPVQGGGQAVLFGDGQDGALIRLSVEGEGV